LGAHEILAFYLPRSETEFDCLLSLTTEHVAATFFGFKLDNRFEKRRNAFSKRQKSGFGLAGQVRVRLRLRAGGDVQLSVRVRVKVSVWVKPWTILDRSLLFTKFARCCDIFKSLTQ